MSPKDAVESRTALRPKAASTSTRDHLIEVGLERMRKNGYGATGLQEILQVAGIPKGSFYHHFGSKEDFTDAVIKRYVARATEHVHQVLGDTRRPPLKRLRRYFEDLILFAGQTALIQGCLLGSLSLEVSGASSLLQASLSSSFAEWQAGIVLVLREAIERGELPQATDPDALAGFVLNSWEGALLRSQVDKSDDPLKDFLHFIFEGLLAKPADARTGMNAPRRR